MKNQMFDQMRNVALLWLEKQDPVQTAGNAGVFFDGEAFHFTSLGQQVRLTYPDYTSTPQLHHWHYLIILHYLHLADGTALTGSPISIGQFSGGMIRGDDFDRRAQLRFRGLEPERLRNRCMELGGIAKDTNADLCMELPFLPMLPVTLHFWQADEDFPASGHLTLDSSADHYLTVEDAVTVGELIMDKLKA